MDTPGAVVTAFFERMEARDWEGAAELLSPEVHIEFTETGERFDGHNFLEMNRSYPGGWVIEVVETIEQDERVAAQIRVSQDEDVFWCAGFYDVAGGVITSGVEHWVTADSAEPPSWRAPFAS